MATTRIRWLTDDLALKLSPPLPLVYAGEDVQLVRGASSRPLRPEVGLITDDGHVFSIAAPTADFVSIRFEPLFAPEQQTSTLIRGHGIEVDLSTGTITAIAAPAPPAPRLRNFLVEAVATVKDPSDPSRNKELERINIRVQVHEAVGDVWLTPSTLTVSADAPGQRFGVFAHMKLEASPPAGSPDSFVMDISRIPGIQWSPPPAATAPIEMDVGGRIKVRSAGNYEVKARLPANWGGADATATVKGVPAWPLQPRERRAAWLVDGPGTARLNEVPNVLFLPEGFLAAEEELFNRLVDELVANLRHSRLFRPFDLFSDAASINHWRAFVPSAERGSTVYPYSRPVGAGEQMNGEPLPEARKPGPADAWTVQHLFYVVGFPTPLDFSITDWTIKRGEWQKLFGMARVPSNRINGQLVDDWATWSFRTLIDERNTAFGLTLGFRRTVDREMNLREFASHPFRIDRAKFELMLASLTDGEGGPTIGHTWTETGKDTGLVVILVSGSRDGGVRGQAAAVASLQRVEVIPIALGPGHHAKIRPYEPPLGWSFGLAAETRGVIVHELCHALGLADEYSEAGHFGVAAGDVSMGHAGNIQPEAELEQTVGHGDLRGDRIRWNWPRIAKAGVATDRPVDFGGGEFVITLRPGHKRNFADGDIAHLRQRPLLRPDPTRAGGVIHAKVSGRLQVVGEQAGEQVLVRDLDGTLVPADFPAETPFESILFMPVPAPKYARALGDKHAGLVARFIRDHVTATHLPLNRKAGGCVWHNEQRLRMRNTPADLGFWQWSDPSLVGVWDGGGTYHCGVYHPAPSCMMNDLSNLTTKFCAVCRYLLVDRVDPSLHGRIDQDYARDYPKRSR